MFRPNRCLTGMKQSRILQEQLQNGQIWEMENSNVQIKLVGKRLVHYKIFKGQTKRSPVSLSGKAGLVQYLTDNKAKLVQA